MTPKIAAAMKTNQTKGSLVAQVTYGSPAQTAGIRGGTLLQMLMGHKYRWVEI